MTKTICDRCGCEINPPWSKLNVEENPIKVDHERWELCVSCAMKFHKFMRREDMEGER